MSFLAIDGERHEVADDVRFAVDLMESDYGAKRGHTTGHEQSPRVAYRFPAHGNAYVLVPFNKRDFSMYVRDLSRTGRRLSAWLPKTAVLDIYPEAGKALNTLQSGKVPYLKPTRDNHVLRVTVPRERLRALLDEYLGVAAVRTLPAAPDAGPPDTTALSSDAPPVGERRPISADEMRDQLDSNSEIGRAGEEIALAYEMDRLRALKCPNPKDHVRPLFESDVGRGYDIESTWLGQMRCIEVKSTTRLGSDIYLSENERVVLKALGDKAWLYRVLVTPDGGRVVGEPLRNPIDVLERSGMAVAVWRAPDPSTAQGAGSGFELLAV